MCMQTVLAPRELHTSGFKKLGSALHMLLLLVPPLRVHELSLQEQMLLVPGRSCTSSAARVDQVDGGCHQCIEGMGQELS